ncbi:MAG TPA: hypothetical protein VGG33_01830 [Polyangia bacterium]
MKTGSARLFAFLILGAAVGCGSESPPSGSGGSPGNSGGSPGNSGGTSGSGGNTGSGGSATGSGGSSSTGTGGTTSGGGGSTGGGGNATGDYFPFAVGNSWEYDVTEMGRPPIKKLNKIVRMEAVGGKSPDANTMAYRVETTKVMTAGQPAGDATISWQLRQGARVVRFREESCAVGSVVLENGSVKSCSKNEDTFWSPARIRIDEMPTGKPLAKDLAWDEMFKENKTVFVTAGSGTGSTTEANQTQSWKVLDVNANAQSPAGNFPNCLVLEKRSMNDIPKKYTFCRGIGKVREEGATQVEALSKYDVKKP